MKDKYLQVLIGGGVSRVSSAKSASIPKDIGSEYTNSGEVLESIVENAIDLKKRVIANRNSKLLEPTSDNIDNHFKKLVILYSSVNNFNNEEHDLYKFYAVLSNSDTKYNIYPLMKDIINGVITEYDIINFIQYQNMSFDIDNILLAYSYIDPEALLNSKIRLVYEKLATSESVIATHELSINTNENREIFIESYYRDQSFSLSSFYDIYKTVFESGLVSDIFSSNFVKEENLLHTIRDYQIRSKLSVFTTEFEIAKQFYNVLAKKYPTVPNKKLENNMFVNTLKDIEYDLKYCPKQWRLLNNSSNASVDDLVKMMIDNEKNTLVKDNLVHPLLYQNHITYDSNKLEILLNALIGTNLSIDINIFHDMLLLISKVCVEFIDVYNTILIERIQDLKILKSTKEELLLNPDNDSDRILSLQADILKLNKLIELITNEIIEYSNLPDNVFFLDAFLLLMDTNVKAITNLSEIHLTISLFLIYTYLFSILNLKINNTTQKESLNTIYKSWLTLFKKVQEVEKEIRETCSDIYNYFINEDDSDSFKLSKGCELLMEVK